MICCPNCGARNFKAEEQLAALSSSPSPDSTSNASRQEVGHAKTGGEIPPTTSPSPGAPAPRPRRCAPTAMGEEVLNVCYCNASDSPHIHPPPPTRAFYWWCPVCDTEWMASTCLDHCPHPQWTLSPEGREEDRQMLALMDQQDPEEPASPSTENDR